MTTLGLFARHPVPGKTKTRLAKSLGNEAAAQFATAFLHDLLKRMPSHADRFLLCATPENQESLDWFQTHAPTDIQLLFQPDGSLGDRIDWFFRSAFADSGEAKTTPAILIGSDSPDLPSSMISKASILLQQTDVVFCPATDGGYTLVGMNQLHANLFDNVAFGSLRTLSQSIDAIQAAGMTCQLLDPWYDVDEVQDLSLLRSRLRTDLKVRNSCPQTFDTLQKYWPNIELCLQQQDQC
ncbi:MAG: TIGR04282 family arsenosugar biosynthesis glycosyltransferase [Fuerstiella sp.]